MFPLSCLRRWTRLFPRPAYAAGWRNITETQRKAIGFSRFRHGAVGAVYDILLQEEPDPEELRR
jgi:hypothetical protein